MKVRKRDTSQKRDSILKAAIQAFQEEGFDNASMDKIAEIAGASKRTIYNHFPSKDELFQVVITKFLEEQHTLKQISYISESTLEQQLSDFADAEIFLINSPTRLGLSKVLTSVFIRDPQLAYTARSKFGPSEVYFVEWLKDAIEDGKIKNYDPKLASRVFYSMIEGALTWPALFQGCQDPKTFEPLKQEIIRTFLARYQRK